MKNRVAELRKKKGWSLAQLAAEVGTTAPQISRLEKGERKLSPDWLVRLSRPFGVPPKYLLLDASQEDVLPEDNFASTPDTERHDIQYRGEDYAPVAVYDAHAAAGAGALNADRPEPLEYRFFPVQWLRALTRSATAALAILVVAGDSMEPTLLNGDQIMIDTDVRSLGRDGLYVIAAEHETQVKRLSRDPRDRSITIRSDNPRAESWNGVSEDLVHVLGRVLWLGRRVEG